MHAIRNADPARSKSVLPNRARHRLRHQAFSTMMPANGWKTDLGQPASGQLSRPSRSRHVPISEKSVCPAQTMNQKKRRPEGRRWLQEHCIEQRGFSTALVQVGRASSAAIMPGKVQRCARQDWTEIDNNPVALPFNPPDDYFVIEIASYGASGDERTRAFLAGLSDDASAVHHQQRMAERMVDECHAAGMKVQRCRNRRQVLPANPILRDVDHVDFDRDSVGLHRFVQAKEFSQASYVLVRLLYLFECRGDRGRRGIALIAGSKSQQRHDVLVVFAGRRSFGSIERGVVRAGRLDGLAEGSV